MLRIPSWLTGNNFWLKALQFVEWTVRVYLTLRRQRIDIINCHSLSALPLCVALATIDRATLVYEPHELETETATFGGYQRRIAKMIERTLIARSAVVITVSESIATAYRHDYGLDDVHVVRNIPPLKTTQAGLSVDRDYLRRRYGIPSDHLIFLYQGALQAPRGIAEILRAFQRCRPDRHVVFLGFGPLTGIVREAAANSPNVHYHEAVKPDDVAGISASADVGIAFLCFGPRNHDFALPNKLFSYLHAGLPVLVSDLQEMRGVVEHFRCGWTMDNTPEGICRVVDRIDDTDIAAAADGAQRSRLELNWETEKAALARIYDEIWRRPPRAVSHETA